MSDQRQRLTKAAEHLEKYFGWDPAVFKRGPEGTHPIFRIPDPKGLSVYVLFHEGEVCITATVAQPYASSIRNNPTVAGNEALAMLAIELEGYAKAIRGLLKANRERRSQNGG